MGFASLVGFAASPCFLLASLVGCSAVSAQACKCPPDPSVSHIRMTRDSGLLRVSGVIVDFQTAQPLPGALVFARPGRQLPSEAGSMTDFFAWFLSTGKEVGSITDSLGWFRFAVPFSDTISVGVQNIGYLPVALPVSSSLASVDFIVTKAPPIFCPLIIGAVERTPALRVVLRSIETREPISDSVSVSILSWATGETVHTRMAPVRGVVDAGLNKPGAYSVTVEGQHYRPWTLPKVLILRDPCNSTTVLPTSHDAWLLPTREAAMGVIRRAS